MISIAVSPVEAPNKLSIMFVRGAPPAIHCWLGVGSVAVECPAFVYAIDIVGMYLTNIPNIYTTTKPGETPFSLIMVVCF
jgi:hypothetical protein